MENVDTSADTELDASEFYFSFLVMNVVSWLKNWYNILITSTLKNGGRKHTSADIALENQLKEIRINLLMSPSIQYFEWFEMLRLRYNRVQKKSKIFETTWKLFHIET